MAATPSIRITKQLPFRGGLREYSTRYHFNGGTPGNTTAWTTLADAVTLAEKAVVPNSTNHKIVAADGYAAGSEVAVFTKVYSLNGTLSTSSMQLSPGECAALVRWQTAARSTKNHPIYCFNYFHGVPSQGLGTEDQLLTAMKTALETYATAWITGFSDGSHTCVRATPRGEGATSRTVSQWITHRDFPL